MLFYQPYCRRGKGKKILGGPKIAKISYCGHSSAHGMKIPLCYNDRKINHFEFKKIHILTTYF